MDMFRIILVLYSATAFPLSFKKGVLVSCLPWIIVCSNKSELLFFTINLTETSTPPTECKTWAILSLDFSINFFFSQIQGGKYTKNKTSELAMKNILDQQNRYKSNPNCNGSKVVSYGY